MTLETIAPMRDDQIISLPAVASRSSRPAPNITVTISASYTTQWKIVTRVWRYVRSPFGRTPWNKILEPLFQRDSTGDRTMFYTDYRLQFPVRVETPSPVFARALQQAIGGVEGEIRVAMQYMFQAWGMKGPGSSRYREMLLNTAAEELGHIEMLATAVAMNLEGAAIELQEEGAADAAVGMIMGGGNLRHFLSAGLAAMPVDAEGVPFDMSHVYASGNIAGDMNANIMAEGTGRTLATRLYHMTNDTGMRDMLSYLIARDTMHQNQWKAVIEELEEDAPQMPVPNSFPQEAENQEFSYVYLGFTADGAEPPMGRWSEGSSVDGQGGTFSIRPMEPMGEVPPEGAARPGTYPQTAQLQEE